jgi:hypothetical protein
MRSDSKRVVSTTMYFQACSLFGICKICRCEDLANFNHVAIFGGTFLHQSNELFLGVGFDHPVPTQDFFCFHERAISDAGLAFAERNAGTP